MSSPTSSRSESTAHTTMTPQQKVSPAVHVMFHHAGKICFASFVVAAFCAVMSLGFLNLSNPLAGLRIREHITAVRSDAWLMAMKELVEQNKAIPARHAQQTESHSPLKLIYSASYWEDDGVGVDNVLTVENIAKIAKIEDTITESDQYQKFCLKQKGTEKCAPLKSCVPYLRNAKTPEELADALTAFRVNFKHGRETSLGADASWFFDANMGDKNSSYALRSEVRHGLPLQGFLNKDDREEEQRKIYKPYMEDLDTLVRKYQDQFKARGLDHLQVFYTLSATFWDAVLEILAGDLSCVAGSAAFIFVVLTVHTRSLFLGITGLVQVLFSFPVCFFVYRVIFQIKLFGALQVISLFIVLGIGADDVFILTDALAQSRVVSHVKHSKLLRLAFASSRAIETMFTTSITSAFAFGATIISVVPAIRYFGVFTCCLVIVNFVLCCTFYLSCLTLWLHYFEDMSYPWEKVHVSEDNKGVELSAMNTVDAVNIKVVVQTDETANSKAKSRRSVQQNRRRSLVSSENLRKYKGRPLEIFFHDRLAPAIVAHWKIILILAGVVFVAMAVVTSYLETGEESIYYPKGHRFDRFFDITTKTFTVKQSSSVKIRVVWGIEGIDRAGTDETNEVDLGKVVYKSTFDLADPLSQVEIHNVCEQIGAQRDRLEVKMNEKNRHVADVKCFMTGFRDWRLGRNVSFPAPKDEFFEELAEFMGRPAGSIYQGQVGLFVQQRKVSAKFAWVEVQGKFTGLEKVSTKEKLANEWYSFLGGRPMSPIGRAYPTGGDQDIFGFFMFTAEQILFVSSAVGSVLISAVFAFFIVFFFTKSVRISLFSLISIALIVVGVLGCIVIEGGKLGSVRSTCVTFLVGFSVDYTVHLAVAYVHSQKRTSGERVIDALSAMGVSVSAAAVSTLGSSCFLFAATFVFFLQFGIFMALAVVWAYLSGTIVFMAFLAGFGPVGREDYQDLRTICKCCWKTNGSKEHSNVEEKIKRTPQTESSAAIQTIARGEMGTVSPARLKRTYVAMVAGLAVTIVVVAVSYALEASRKNLQEELVLATDESYFMPPSLNDLAVDKWTELRPVGNTKCARGTPFVFFVKHGQAGSKKVLIEFMGGGACWSKQTCGLQTAIFSETAENARRMFRDLPKTVPKKGHPGASDFVYPYRGIGDVDSPFSEYTHIFVPYCTGDLHWGDNEVQYTQDLKIFHTGGRNAKVVMDWIYSALPSDPEMVFVTGCSAGSYGSLMWSSHVMDHYKNKSTKVVQFGDSGMGVITGNLGLTALWNVSGQFPFHVIPNHTDAGSSMSASQMSEIRSGNFSSLSLPTLYRWIGQANTKHAVSQFSSAYDWNQAFFLRAMTAGGSARLADKLKWNSEMTKIYDAGNLSSVPNYYEFVSEGDNHCVILMNRYWNQRGRMVGSGKLGTFYLSDWVYNMTTLQPVPKDVACPGSCKIGLDVTDLGNPNVPGSIY